MLEKDQKGAFSVSDHDVARVLKRIGLDERPGVQVEAVQICPNGRGLILITLKPNVNADNFCRHEVFEATSTGKREVAVTIKGLHPNTRDDGVIDYLGSFAKVVTTKVIHGVFTVQGLKNGDR